MKRRRRTMHRVRCKPFNFTSICFWGSILAVIADMFLHDFTFANVVLWSIFIVCNLSLIVSRYSQKEKFENDLESITQSIHIIKDEKDPFAIFVCVCEFIIVSILLFITFWCRLGSLSRFAIVVWFSFILFFSLNKVNDTTDENSEKDIEKQEPIELEIPNTLLQKARLDAASGRYRDFGAFCSEKHLGQIFQDPFIKKCAVNTIIEEGWDSPKLDFLPKSIMDMLWDESESEAESSSSIVPVNNQKPMSFHIKSICYILAIVLSLVILITCPLDWKACAGVNFFQSLIPFILGIFGKNPNCFRPQKIFWIILAVVQTSYTTCYLAFPIIFLGIVIIIPVQEKFDWFIPENDGLIVKFHPVGWTGIPVFWKTIEFCRAGGILKVFEKKWFQGAPGHNLSECCDPEYHATFTESLFLGCGRVIIERHGKTSKGEPESNLVIRLPSSLAKQAAYKGGEVDRLIEIACREQGVSRLRHS